MSSNSSKDELVSSLNSLGIEVVAGKVRRSDIKKALAGATSVTVDNVEVVFNGSIDPAFAKVVAGSLMVPVRNELKKGRLKLTKLEVTLA